MCDMNTSFMLFTLLVVQIVASALGYLMFRLIYFIIFIFIGYSVLSLNADFIIISL